MRLAARGLSVFAGGEEPVLVMGVSEGAPDAPAPSAGMLCRLLLKTDDAALDSELAEPMPFTRSPGEMT